jgi:hypothetical protein
MSVPTLEKSIEILASDALAIASLPSKFALAIVTPVFCPIVPIAEAARESARAALNC